MDTFAIEEGPGGWPRGLLTHESGARVEVHPHGAHVTSWRDATGRERLFLSRRSAYGAGVAIRGGVPVIFPQFAGRGALPRHGFARTSAWTVAGHGTDGGGRARVALALESDARTLAVWPHRFRVELHVGLDARELTLRLRVSNPGEAAFHFTCALHSYLRVDDVERARLLGLPGAPYEDSARGGAAGVQRDEVLTFAGEIDRIYHGAPDRVVLLDGDRALDIGKAGFPDLVVWNPGPEKAAALPDMAAAEHREMLCVEAAAAGAAVRLEPGAEWVGEQRLSTRPPA